MAGGLRGVNQLIDQPGAFIPRHVCQKALEAFGGERHSCQVQAHSSGECGIVDHNAFGKQGLGVAEDSVNSSGQRFFVSFSRLGKCGSGCKNARHA